jgi:hypothetical protein
MLRLPFQGQQAYWPNGDNYRYEDKCCHKGARRVDGERHEKHPALRSDFARVIAEGRIDSAESHTTPSFTSSKLGHFDIYKAFVRQRFLT